MTYKIKSKIQKTYQRNTPKFEVFFNIKNEKTHLINIHETPRRRGHLNNLLLRKSSFHTLTLRGLNQESKIKHFLFEQPSMVVVML